MTAMSSAGAAALCSGCGKPLELCVCAAISAIANRVEVVILRHPHEKRHVLGSAWLAHRQLKNSRLVTGLSWPSLKRILGRDIDPRRWGVLYMGKAEAKRPASAVAAIDKSGKPLEDQAAVLAALDGIVAIDGTWAQAKTLWWRNPWLLRLRRLVIDPRFRSVYGGLRREPRRQALSTLEAIGVCLAELEGDPARVEHLTKPLKLLLTKYRDRASD
jgi:DTW domain-containing protein YfiP